MNEKNSFQIEQSVDLRKIICSHIMCYAIMPNSQIRSFLFAASRRLSRSSLKYTRGISCVRGRFYQNQFFSELMARGWVSSFSLTSRRGQRTDTNGLLPGAVFRPYHTACFRSGSDTRILFLFSFASLSWYWMWIIHETTNSIRHFRIRLFISGALVYIPDWIPDNKIEAKKDHIDFIYFQRWNINEKLMILTFNELISQDDKINVELMFNISILSSLKIIEIWSLTTCLFILLRLYLRKKILIMLRKYFI